MKMLCFSNIKSIKAKMIYVDGIFIYLYISIYACFTKTSIPVSFKKIRTEKKELVTF